MTSSVVALLLARLTGFNSAGVSEKKGAHLLIYNCRFGDFIVVPGPGCLPQMGSGDFAECFCMFGCLIGRQNRSVELEWCVFGDQTTQNDGGMKTQLQYVTQKM